MIPASVIPKVVVAGDGRGPLYKYLTDAKTSPLPGPIRWNFEKFLIGRDGRIAARFDPDVEPTDEKVLEAIEAELAKK